MEQRERRTGFKIEPLLGGLALLILLVGCVVVLKPFLSPLMWAIVLAYCLYPLQCRFTTWFRGSRTLAACLVTLTLTLLLAGPVVLIGLSLVEDGRAIAGATKKWFLSVPQEAPEWVAQLPVVGDEAAIYWKELNEGRKRERWMSDLEKAAEEGEKRAKHDAQEHATFVEPPAPLAPPAASANETAPANEDDANDTGEKADTSKLITLLGWTLGMVRRGLLIVVAAVGQGMAQVILSAFLAFFLLRDASVLSQRLKIGVERLAGERGKHLLQVAGDTVKGVVYGILGTALTQAIVAGLGFWIAGVPGVILLGVLTFFSAVIPFGPPIVWVPATLWLFAQGRPGWGIFMLIWGVFGISGVDNVVRPLIISQGSKMPFVLIFCGVIGGAFAFGLVGVFLGPTLLAVAYRLVDEWSTLQRRPALEPGPATMEDI